MTDANIIKVKKRKFFYDAQLTRLMLQLGTKVFGGYEVVSGTQRDGKVRFKEVPTIYGGMQRAASYTFGGGSDNVVPSLPMICYTLTSMQRNAKMAQEPILTQEHVVHVRARDANGNLLVNQPGEYLKITRMMPVPYNIGIELSIWASNTDQLHQLVEMICSVFNPDLEIALTNSPLDWSAITSVIYEGGVAFSDVKPAASADPVQIATMQFRSLIWLSLPAKVEEAHFIHDVKVNIHQLEDYGFFMYGDNIDIINMPVLDNMEIRASDLDIDEHQDQ